MMKEKKISWIMKSDISTKKALIFEIMFLGDRNQMEIVEKLDVTS